MTQSPEISRQPRQSEADPQGQAALLLVESLCHVLIEKGALSRAAVLEAVETAADVKLEIALEGHERQAIAQRSLGYLKAIMLSIASNGAGDGGQARKH